MLVSRYHRIGAYYSIRPIHVHAPYTVPEVVHILEPRQEDPGEGGQCRAQGPQGGSGTCRPSLEREGEGGREREKENRQKTYNNFIHLFLSHSLSLSHLLVQWLRSTCHSVRLTSSMHCRAEPLGDRDRSILQEMKVPP